MKCSTCLAQLAAYHDGELSNGAAAAIAGHLASCAGCRDFDARLGAVEARLTGLQPIEPRPDFTRQVMARVAVAPAPAVAPRFVPGLSFWWIGIYVLLAWGAVAGLSAAHLINIGHAVVAGGGLFVKIGALFETLYHVAHHFHIQVYAAIGAAVEIVFLITLAVFARRYLSRIGATPLGVRSS